MLNAERQGEHPQWRVIFVVLYLEFAHIYSDYMFNCAYIYINICVLMHLFLLAACGMHMHTLFVALAFSAPHASTQICILNDGRKHTYFLLLLVFTTAFGTVLAVAPVDMLLTVVVTVAAANDDLIFSQYHLHAEICKTFYTEQMCGCIKQQ